MTSDEIVRFWKGCKELGPPYGPLFKLLLLSGARLNEGLGMTRAEISAEGTWTIPSTRTKNHREHVLPLPPLALDQIGDVAAGFVFTLSGGRLGGLSKIKKRLDEAMGSPAPWRLHDLRRTAATGMAELGIAPHIVEAVLNHVGGSKGGVAGIYNRAMYAEEKQAALARWAAHVEGLVTGKRANVTSFSRRRRR